MDFDSLFDEDPDETLLESGNVYLQDSKRALDLLFRIYGNTLEIDKQRERNIVHLQDTFNKKLPEIVGKIPFTSEKMREHFLQIPALAANVVEHARLPFLRNKTIIGIGGQFSAGKSRFLNTFFEDEYLPHDQGPTTAIGTYIVQSSDFSIHAFSNHGRLEQISFDELKAISHAFSEKYGIGFSHILDKIIIRTPNFSKSIPNNIALLDTPGYNKPDEAHSGSTTYTSIDERLAREHLLHCDFLIWLIAVDNGCITNDDLRFIASLKLSHRCLLVFNKADLRTDEQVKETIKKTKDIMDQNAIPYYGITAFSSIDGKECFGASLLQQFFEESKNYNNQNNDLVGKIQNIKEYWQTTLQKQKSLQNEILQKIQRTILASGEPNKISSLLRIYLAMSHEARDRHYCSEDFNWSIEKLNRDLKQFR